MGHAYTWGGHISSLPRSTLKSLASEASKQIWQSVKNGGLRETENGLLIPSLWETKSTKLIKDYVVRTFGRGSSVWSDTELIVSWPEEPIGSGFPNNEPDNRRVDRNPQGGLYDIVVGVYLNKEVNAVDIEGYIVSVEPGDIVWWRGDTLHRGLKNYDDYPKFSLYYRKFK